MFLSSNMSRRNLGYLSSSLTNIKQPTCGTDVQNAPSYPFLHYFVVRLRDIFN